MLKKLLNKWDILIIFIFFFSMQIANALFISNTWDERTAIDSAGKFIQKLKISITNPNSPILEEFTVVEYYGSFVALPVHLFTIITFNIQSIKEFAIASNYIINEFDYYFFLRHLALNLYVILALFIIYKLLKKMESKKFAVWFVVFIFLYPNFSGHALFNFTDIPLALNLFLTSIYFIYLFDDKKFSNPSIKDKILLGFLISSCLLVRATSIIFIAFLVLFRLITYILTSSKNISSFTKDNVFIFSLSFLLYFIGTPAMWLHPILYSSKILSFQYDNPWRGTMLTNGVFVNGSDPTASYLLTWLTFQTPIIFILFFFVGIKYKKLYKFNLRNYSLFLIVTVLISHVVLKPLTYDGLRHYLFLIPFIITIAVYGYFFLYENISNKNIWIPFVTLLYLFNTQLPFSHYKYAYFNELTPASEISYYCEEINGCGNWPTDYWGASGKEIIKLIENYNFEPLLACEPKMSTTLYMDHSKIPIDNFWIFKNNIPVHNETTGFDQYKLIYSEGHFKDAIKNQKIRKFYALSIHRPEKNNDACGFFEMRDEYSINCNYVDSVNRVVRGSKVYFSYLSECKVDIVN